MVISKQIKFDCAHMLSDYQGKCANLHGHTYHGMVVLVGQVKPETSMVLDYNVIKDVVDDLDHAIIFSEAKQRNVAETELFHWAETHGMRKVELFNGKSTAENIAQYLADRFLSYSNIDHVRIDLSETDGSTACVEASK